MEEEVHADYFLDGLVGMFYFPIDCWDIYAYVLYNGIIVKNSFMNYDNKEISLTLSTCNIEHLSPW